MSRRLRWALVLVGCGPLVGCGDDGGASNDDLGSSSASGTDGEGSDILEQLEAIPGMRVIEQTAPEPGTRLFELYFRVPNDHHDPDGPSFELFMTLIHRSTAAPTVFYTSGYHNYIYDYEVELSRWVSGNQLAVEKRFTGSSRPDGAWSLLDAEQVAADGHLVVEALRTIYTAPWLRSGVSLGGEDAIHHHYFHPDDFAGVVAYVSPFVLGLADTRFVDHFATAVPQPCQAQLESLQAVMLGEHRAGLLAELETRVDPEDLTLIGGYDRALQTLVLELPWSVWQIADETLCPLLPSPADPGLTPLTLVELLDDVVGVDMITDPSLETWQAYAYQAFTQLGRPALPLAHLEGLVDPDYFDLETVVPPPGVPLPFEEAFVPAIHDWVGTQATDIIFVYGSLDPWAAGRIDAAANGGVVTYFDPAGNHGTKIEDLGASEQQAIEDQLVMWLGRELDPLQPPRMHEPRIRVPR